jgi:hypothetical protein
MSINKPEKVRTDVEQVGDDLVLTRRSGASLFFGVIVVGLLVPWTIYDAVLLARLSGWPSPLAVLVCSPLYLFWPFAAVLAVQLLTGSETLQIGPGGVALGWRSWIGKAQRQVPLEEIRGLAREPHLDRLPWNPPEILTWGEPIRFGGCGSEDVGWLTGLIEQRLRELLAARSENDPLPPPGSLPADSSLRVRHLADGIVLDGPGERGFGPADFGCAGCAGLLALFVSGLVVFTIVTTLGQPSLGGVVLSTLGVLVGLFMIAQFIGISFAMFGRQTSTFTPEMLTVRGSVFGVGWTSRYPEWRLRGVEVNASPGRQEWRDPMIVRLEVNESLPLSDNYWLGLPGRDGKAFDSIYLFELNAVEARWVIRLLCDRFQGTLSKGGTAATFLATEPATLWDRELDR